MYMRMKSEHTTKYMNKLKKYFGIKCQMQENRLFEERWHKCQNCTYTKHPITEYILNFRMSRQKKKVECMLRTWTYEILCDTNSTSCLETSFDSRGRKSTQTHTLNFNKKYFKINVNVGNFNKRKINTFFNFQVQCFFELSIFLKVSINCNNKGDANLISNVKFLHSNIYMSLVFFFRCFRFFSLLAWFERVSKKS